MKITACRSDLNQPDAEFVALPEDMRASAAILLDGENVADRCRWVDPDTGEGWLYDVDGRGHKRLRLLRRHGVACGAEVAGRFVRGLVVEPHPGFEDAWAALAAGGAPGAAAN